MVIGSVNMLPLYISQHSGVMHVGLMHSTRKFYKSCGESDMNMYDNERNKRMRAYNAELIKGD